MKVETLIFWAFLIMCGCSKTNNNNSSKINSEINQEPNLVSEPATKMDKNNGAKTTVLKSDVTENVVKDTFAITEDIIRRHTNISDSIKIIDVKKYGSHELQHVYAFIDYNFNSKFHEWIDGGYGFSNETDKEQYERIFRDKNITAQLNTTLLSKYVGNWTPVYSYQGEFYNYYSHCEFRNKGFTLSDSTFIHYYMDGLAPSVITEIKEDGNKIEIHFGKTIYTMELIDPERSVYLFDERGFRQYVIRQSEINNFPIIVEDCHEVGGQIVEFDKILKE